MTIFYLTYDENKPNGEEFTEITLNKKQAKILFDKTIDTMQQISKDNALMWEMNYEITDYFALDAGGELSPEHFRTAVHTVLDVCKNEPELKDIYEPIKTALMADPRFKS